MTENYLPNQQILNDLLDVNASIPNDNDALVWDSGTSRWIPDASAGADEKVKASATDPSSGYLDAKVDNSTLEVSSEKLQIKAGGVDSTEIADLAVGTDQLGAGAVTNSKLNADSDAIDNASTVIGVSVTAALDTLKTASDLNTTHSSSDGTDHANVVLNDTHRTTVTGNPHNVTPSEIGAGTDDITNNSDVTGATATDALNNLETLGITGGEALYVISANYNITDIDGTGYIYVSTGATDRTILLPQVFGSAVNEGRKIFIKKIDSGIGAVIVEGKGYGTGNQENIDGEGRRFITQQYDSIRVKAEGPATASWRTLNREWAMRVDSTINAVQEDIVFIGHQAGNTWAAGAGYNDLVFIGTCAGANNTGTSVVAVGEDAGEDNTGDNCVMVGEDAGRNNDGDSCALVGRDAGWSNAGNFTVGIGRTSVRDNEGRYVVGIGSASASNNAGENTIGIGRSAGNYVDGNNNIYLGEYAGANSTGNTTYTASTIAFVDSDPDTITDSASQFVIEGFSSGDVIEVTGGPNDGKRFTIDTVLAGTITLISRDSVTAAVSGASITITEGGVQAGTRSLGIGQESARYLNASDCVCLGAFAGYANGEDNRLFIHSSAADVGDDALISGDFSAQWVRINKDLIVADEIQSESANPIILNADTTGAIQTDSGGNARGSSAIDFQKTRLNATEIASGSYAFIGGGYQNTASGDASNASGYDTTASGLASTSSGSGTIAANDYTYAGGLNSGTGADTAWAFGDNASATGNVSHAEGQDTTASGDYSHAEGNSTTASGDYSHAEGAGCTASGDASHAEGSATLASGLRSHAEGGSTEATGLYSHAEGRQTIASGTHSHAEGYLSWATELRAHASGYYALASHQAEFARAAGRFSQRGDAQYMINVQRRATTDATEAELTIDGTAPNGDNRLVLPDETTWMFTIQLSAYNDTDNLAAGYFFKGVIRRDAVDSTVIIGAIEESIWEEGAMSACSVSVEADDIEESLVILVTGIAAKNIRWHAKVDISQVSYGSP